MSKKDRDFKGVWIPKAIWLDKDLSLVEKCLLVEIDSLDNDPERGCFADDSHFAEFLNLSEKRVRNVMTDLKKRGHLTRCYWDGRNRGLRVCYPGLKPGFSKGEPPIIKRAYIPSVRIHRKLKNLRGSTYKWAKTRAKVFERDNYTCVYCGNCEGPFECDHIVPFSKGGSDSLSNLTTACQKCNKQKRDRSLLEFLVWRTENA